MKFVLATPATVLSANVAVVAHSTGRVTSRTVRSPRIVNSASPDFVDRVLSRRDLELHNRFASARARRRELQEAERYGEMLRLVETLRGELRDDATLVHDRLERFEESTRSAIDLAYRRFEFELGYLEFPDTREECLALFGRALESFAGTPHVDSLREHLDRFEGMLRRVAIEELRRRQALVRRLADRASERDGAGDGASDPEGKSVRIGLSALLAGPVRAGRLAERRYDFGPFTAAPIGVEESVDDVRLVFDGGPALSFGEVPARVQLRMAGDCLAGDDLLAAATYGFGEGLDGLAGKLLEKYRTERGADREERQRRIDELLVTVRGLDAVPEGGFSYDPAHGWEDAEQKAGRLAVKKAAGLARTLRSASTMRTITRTFDTIAGLLDDRALPARARTEIRKQAIAALEEVQRRGVEDLEKLVKRTGFEQIREAKRELNRRRREALAVIFDATVYVPEDHPDWRRGDVANGQAEVDRVVDRVRELWDGAAKYTVSLSPTARKKIDLIRRIREDFLPRLGRRKRRAKDDPLEELWNNLDGRIDLRTLALDHTETLAFRYNRRVERYNSELDSDDVSEEDRVHVVVVNDYREMLGLRRLFIDARLCRATRKHSAVCDAAGRIWHNGSDGTPGSRAAAEGFPGGVGENVALGYADSKDIWIRGWYRASDHHRNALASGWTCIGYGQSGRVGTQNFGSISPPW